jgi:ribosomal protein L20A (L18A)
LTCPGQVVRQEKERTENLKLELDASNREENAIGTLPEDVSSRRKIVRKENGRNQ